MNNSLTKILQCVSDENRKGINYITGESSESFISYNRLYRVSLSMLYCLQQRGLKAGDKLVFQIEDSQEFINVFWACQLGGIIPIPVTVGNNDEHRLKVFKISDILGSCRLIAVKTWAEKMGKFASASGLGNSWEKIKADLILLEELQTEAQPGLIAGIKPDDTAFIQFSSGSTSDPKGIILTHRNLQINIDAMIRGSKLSSSDSTLSWMPLTHDMGLIGFHLVPLAAAANQHIIPTQLFIRHPMIWMDKACKHKATILSSPNFGYKHFMSSFSPEKHKDWDLSHVRLIFNGAEPISAEISRTFLHSLAGAGLKENAMFPVYGLAEASLAVSFPPVEEELKPIQVDRGSLKVGKPVKEISSNDAVNGMTFVDLGSPVDDCNVMISDDDENALEENVLGHVLIKGGNVTKGYFNNQAATEKTINQKGWLDTGDLGYLRNGRLVITGRAKDIIFINGQNYYPHDIELIADGFESIKLGEIAVCGVFNKSAMKEEAVIFLRSKAGLDKFAPLAVKLKQHLSKKLGFEVGEVVPVKVIPKTTSGKIQRYKLGQAYGAGHYDDLLKELRDIIALQEKERRIDPPRNDGERSLHSLWRELLDREDISINDDFFALGGDSLKAVRLAAAIKQRIKKEITIDEIFENPTITSLAYLLEARPGSTYTPVPKAEIKKHYPLSAAQKRIFILSQMDPEDLSYNLPAALMIEGRLDHGLLEDCFRKLIARHQLLRASYGIIGNEPRQTIHDEVPFRLETTKVLETDVQFIIEDFVRAFDLKRAPLLRAKLLQLSDEKNLLLFDIHHLISDGTSLGILIGELSSLYQGQPLPEPDCEYTDYVSWQEERQKSDEFMASGKYWLETFRDGIPVLDLPSDNQRPAKQSHRGSRLHFTLSSEVTFRLKELARENRSTLYMTLLAAISVLLSRHSGQQDMVIGSPVAGRAHDDLKKTVGMFVNTLALRCRPEGENRFADYLEEVSRICFEAYNHQEYPFEELVEKIVRNRDLSRNPLFDVMFTLQNIELPEFDIPGLKFKPYRFERSTAQFDLTFEAREEQGGLSFTLEYNSQLFERDRIERMIGHLKNILEEVTKDPGIKLSEMEILPEAEKHRLLVEFNDTALEYDRKRTVVDHFEETTAMCPDRIALAFAGQEMSYRELNDRSNLIAGELRKAGVVRESIVGLMADRGLGMMAGLLGIMKAGGAYLPIDPVYPIDRIDYMLADSGAGWLVGDANNLGRVKYAGINVPLEGLMALTGEAANPERVSRPEDPAYIIYTSGSTGRPKGVMVEHRNLTNFILGMDDVISFNRENTILCLTTISFDIFFLESILPLTLGMKVIVAGTESQRDPLLLSRLVTENRIGLMQITPSRLQMLLADEAGAGCLKNVKCLLVGGEVLPAALLKEARKHTKADIFNMYGPTETTIWSAVKNLGGSEKVTLGRPIANTRIFITGKNRLQPIGVPGELWIGGEGVARGYANAPEMTADRFVTFPQYDALPIYRTGDLARWLPDGEIEFLGRNDNQVKVRGYRVELGEIEDRLAEYPGIKEAAVTVREDAGGNQILCGYYSALQGIQPQEIRKHMAQSLPEYMVPSHLMQMPALPQTHNGKIDRKALPDPSGQAEVDAKLPPRNPIDEGLADIWKELLGLAEIGIDDNFFWLGGHSLKATVMASTIRKKFGVEVPLIRIFEQPTIRQISDAIAQARTVAREEIPAAPERESYPLSPAQKRLYVLNQFEKDSTVYNLPAAFWVDGELDMLKLKNALLALIERHDSLRTCFEVREDQPVQIIGKNVDFEVEDIAAGADGIENAIQCFIRPFDLGKAPLMRVGLLKEGNRSLLLFDMHHIISDGESLGLIIKEISTLYRGQKSEALRLQYKDYSVWQETHISGEQVKAQEKYWLERFSEDVPLLDLPSDFTRPSVQSFEGDRVSFRLDPRLSGSIRRLARENGATLYMTLLAAYSILISRYSRQEDLVVGTPVAGRAHGGLDQLVGMFVNTLALRIKPEGGKSFGHFLNDVKACVMEATQNQDYPFDRLVEKLAIPRDVSRNPLFDAMFAMQETDDSNIEFSGIRLKPYPLKTGISQFDLTMDAVDSPSGILIILEYSSRLFGRDRIERMGDHFRNILEEVSRDPGIKLSEIDILSEAERRKLLVEYNGGSLEYDRKRTVVEQFEDRAGSQPEDKAIVFNGQEMSHGELNNRANLIAGELRGLGVTRESIVGLIADRGLGMMAGLLGILKAGGAYLPIDPEYPLERIEYILKDSGAGWLLGDDASLAKVAHEVRKVGLNELMSRSGEAANPERVSRPEDLAYIIYTSGSTGRPKGVMVEHRNLNAYVHSFLNQCGTSGRDVMLQQASITFDTSVEEIFPILLSGGRLVLASKQEVNDTARLKELITRNNVTVVSCSPLLLNELNQPPVTGCVQTYISGGDVLKYGHMSNLTERARVINGYGPTETTVAAIFYQCRGDEQGAVPIGRPIANWRAYLVDKYGKPVPIGVPGEILLGGEGVTRGYLGRPELTAEKFIQDPFTGRGRLYRSGDLARWRTDGNIEFLGRADQQLKIRGFRIEPGEIEAKLMSHPSISEAAVAALAGEDGNKYLCAYIASGQELTVMELREYLSGDLPEYMIPARFVCLDKLPVTSHGKLDRKALERLDGRMSLGSQYLAPSGEMESRLAVIWQEVLGVEQVGVNDNFFALGGDSIKAIQIMARLGRQGYGFEMAELFRAPTVRELALNCKASGIQAEQGPVTGEVPLTPIQRYFFARNFTDRHHWNQSVMLSARDVLDAALIKQAFAHLIAHHDALRMVYRFENDNVIQYNQGMEQHLFSFREADLRGVLDIRKEADEISGQIQAGLDLERGPLVSLGLFRTDQGDHLLIVIHHLAVDGVSWRILLEDLSMLYDQLLKGAAAGLPPKTVSFKTWAENLDKYAQSSMLQREKDHWQGLVKCGARQLPKDGPAGDDTQAQSAIEDFQLTADQTAKLNGPAHQAYNTEINDLLLSALALAVREWTGLDSIAVNLEGHGREQALGPLDVSRTVGWFTSQYPVILEIPGSGDLGYIIKSIKESLRNVPNKGIGYGLLRYMSKAKAGEYDLTPEISFNYLGHFNDHGNNGKFGLSEMPAGAMLSPRSQRDHALDINCLVLKGRLTVKVSYNRQQYREETIGRFLKHFSGSLNSIIGHCLGKETSESTPADYGAKDLSMEELGDILDMVDSI
ncbi:amino acid adenylation domain-containing protein [candidate division TA06 bacterium]|nr:amino acid adenylation domain-containing protein [candidate division TA06 bacterium]